MTIVLRGGGGGRVHKVWSIATARGAGSSLKVEGHKIPGRPKNFDVP